MPWFVAHNLMVLRPQTPIDEPLLCWENVILLEAEYDAKVWEMAMKRAIDVDASDKFEMTPHYSVPARWEFAGTRSAVFHMEALFARVSSWQTLRRRNS